MPGWETGLGWAMFLMFFAGVVFIHLRLRSLASRVLIVSLSLMLVWGKWGEPAVRSYLFDTARASHPATPHATVGPQSNAEAFQQMPTSAFDHVSEYVLVALLFTSCLSFLVSARSIPRRP